ncbi:hypothetical protein BTN49_0835 [Candidatus Enterovibrio escicola]|uniref:Uncharacterized protein n=1 Tax=Candidatus Enterovibrio escicola TaxID=1927127 RepID=A0A2A5T6U1_9GAMM|nr:hypothetical protein BTN49_0835 [Candidatus Enterovibrio escacola]
MRSVNEGIAKMKHIFNTRGSAHLGYRSAGDIFRVFDG